jgi:hypothetical protein
MHKTFRTGVAGLALAAAVTTGATATASATSSATSGPSVTTSGPVGLAAVRVLAAADGSARGDLFGPVTTPAKGKSLGWRVRVRSAPISGWIKDHLYRGERVTVLCVTRDVLRDGHDWARVRTANGVRGWTRTDLVTWRAAAPIC